MKVRNGFVSNSSSSSFICAVAKIVDKTKAEEWLKSLNLDKYDYVIQKVKDMFEDEFAVCCYKKSDGTVIVDSFQTGVSIKGNELEPEDEILAINIINDEGDSEFSIYDEDGDWCDYDYDIELSFFPDNQAKAYTGLIEENGFTLIRKTYGAGRNG